MLNRFGTDWESVAREAEDGLKPIGDAPRAEDLELLPWSGARNRANIAPLVNLMPAWTMLSKTVQDSIGSQENLERMFVNMTRSKARTRIDEVLKTNFRERSKKGSMSETFKTGLARVWGKTMQVIDEFTFGAVGGISRFTGALNQQYHGLNVTGALNQTHPEDMIRTLGRVTYEFGDQGGGRWNFDINFNHGGTSPLVNMPLANIEQAVLNGELVDGITETPPIPLILNYDDRREVVNKLFGSEGWQIFRAFKRSIEETTETMVNKREIYDPEFLLQDASRSVTEGELYFYASECLRIGNNAHVNDPSYMDLAAVNLWPTPRPVPPLTATDTDINALNDTQRWAVMYYLQDRINSGVPMGGETGARMLRDMRNRVWEVARNSIVENLRSEEPEMNILMKEVAKNPRFLMQALNSLSMFREAPNQERERVRLTTLNNTTINAFFGNAVRIMDSLNRLPTNANFDLTTAGLRFYRPITIPAIPPAPANTVTVGTVYDPTQHGIDIRHLLGGKIAKTARKMNTLISRASAVPPPADSADLTRQATELDTNMDDEFTTLNTTFTDTLTAIETARNNGPTTNTLGGRNLASGTPENSNRVTPRELLLKFYEAEIIERGHTDRFNPLQAAHLRLNTELMKFNAISRNEDMVKTADNSGRITRTLVNWGTRALKVTAFGLKNLYLPVVIGRYLFASGEGASGDKWENKKENLKSSMLFDLKDLVRLDRTNLTNRRNMAEPVLEDVKEIFGIPKDIKLGTGIADSAFYKIRGGLDWKTAFKAATFLDILISQGLVRDNNMNNIIRLENLIQTLFSYANMARSCDFRGKMQESTAENVRERGGHKAIDDRLKNEIKEENNELDDVENTFTQLFGKEEYRKKYKHLAVEYKFLREEISKRKRSIPEKAHTPTNRENQEAVDQAAQTGTNQGGNQRQRNQTGGNRGGQYQPNPNPPPAPAPIPIPTPAP